MNRGTAGAPGQWPGGRGTHHIVRSTMGQVKGDGYGARVGGPYTDGLRSTPYVPILISGHGEAVIIVQEYIFFFLFFFDCALTL